MFSGERRDRRRYPKSWHDRRRPYPQAGQIANVPKRYLEVFGDRRAKKLFAVSDQLPRSRVALRQDGAEVVGGTSARRSNEIVDIPPFLGPHMAEQIGRNQAVAAFGNSTVSLHQL